MFSSSLWAVLALAAVIAVIAVAAAVIYLIHRQERLSRKTVSTLTVLDNNINTALPQTAVHTAVTAHFAAPLPAGKAVKKAIILGFDGARCDSLANLSADGKSGILHLKKSGGVYVSYAGGEAKKGQRQNTDTAPGWASILTGKWAKEHGAAQNGIIKPVSPPSLLISLPEKYNGLKASFNMLWSGHWDRSAKGTYCDEFDYAEKNQLALEVNHVKKDSLLHELLLKKVTAEECDDFMMCIYERPDENGHGTGFGNANPKYVEAVTGCDRDAFEVISAIEARKSFPQEDWLIIITSDHGGKGRGHGGQSFMERETFIAANKKIF